MEINPDNVLKYMVHKVIIERFIDNSDLHRKLNKNLCGNSF